MHSQGTTVLRSMALAIIAAGFASLSSAQGASSTTPSATPAAAPSATALPSSLDALAWLRGCWAGAVNRRDFLEHWSPPRGGMMVGFSHTMIAPRSEDALKERLNAPAKAPAEQGKERTQDYEYLRLEARSDGIYYVAVPSGKKEVVFKLTEVSEDSGARLFTFTNLVDEFPQRLVYRHGTEGWLYAQVTGKSGKGPGDVVYPMRHVDCTTDALLKE